MKLNPAATTLQVHRHIPAPEQETEEKKALPAPTQAGEADPALPKTASAEITHAPRTPEEDNEKEKTRGVLRLLEEGHFRGVADVRLRINFYDELAARASENAGPVANDKANDLLNSINIHVGKLLETLPIDEGVQEKVDELLSEFDASVNTMIEKYGSDTSQAELTKQLQTAFDLLVSQLHDLLAPSIKTPDVTLPEEPEEDPTDGPGAVVAVEGQGEAVNEEEGTAVPIEGVADGDGAAPDSGGEQPDAGTVDPFQNVLDAFSQALAELLTSITSAVQLPDPAPPNGNGVAYDKFLAIYNQLRGIAPRTDETA